MNIKEVQHFFEYDMKIGLVEDCIKVANSSKLLKLTVNFGEFKKTILTGLQKYFEPQDFIGKKMPFLLNIPEVKMAGEISQGMLIAAEDAKSPVFLIPERDLEPGSTVK
jgi:tRNA-binding protein